MGDKRFDELDGKISGLMVRQDLVEKRLVELEERVRSLKWLVKDMALKDVEKQEPTVKAENKSDMYCEETATEAAAVAENIISEIIKKKADEALLRKMEALAEYKVEFDKKLGRFTVTRPASTEKSGQPEIYVVVVDGI